MKMLAERSALVAMTMALIAMGCGSPGTDAGPEMMDDGVMVTPDAGPDMGGMVTPDDGPLPDAGVDSGPPTDDGPLPDEGPIPTDFGPPLDDGPLPPDEGPFDGGPIPLPCPEFSPDNMPANDLGTATGDAVATGVLLAASDSTDPSEECTEGGPALGGNDIAWVWEAPQTAPYTFSTDPTESDTILYLLDPVVDDVTGNIVCTGEELACSDDISVRDLQFGSSVQVRLEAGDQIIIVIDSRGATGIPYTLNIERGEAFCDDGTDDDGDSLIDCRDPDCDVIPVCIETICDDGIDNEDDGLTDCDDPQCLGTVACPQGEIVLMGYDFDNANASFERVLRNAILQTDNTGTIEIGFFDQWKDPSTFGVGECDDTEDYIDDEMTAAGRTYNLTNMSDSAAVPTDIFDHDVFIVCENENAPFNQFNSLAPTWQPAILDYLNAGGIVVIISSFDEEWRLVNGPDFFTIGGDNNLFGTQTNTVRATTDPIAAGLPATFTSTTQTSAFTGASGGVIIADNPSGPTIMRLDF